LLKIGEPHPYPKLPELLPVSQFKLLTLLLVSEIKLAQMPLFFNASSPGAYEQRSNHTNNYTAYSNDANDKREDAGNNRGDDLIAHFLFPFIAGGLLGVIGFVVGAGSMIVGLVCLRISIDKVSK
jgi:hypothetical protein